MYLYESDVNVNQSLLGLPAASQSGAAERRGGAVTLRRRCGGAAALITQCRRAASLLYQIYNQLYNQQIYNLIYIQLYDQYNIIPPLSLSCTMCWSASQ